MAEEFKEKGNTFFKEKQYQAAAEEYTKAIDLLLADNNNNNTDLLSICYNNRAASYHGLKQFDKSLQDAKQSIEINEKEGFQNKKNSIKSFSRAATALWGMGKYKEAREYYNTILTKLNNNDETAKDGVQKLDDILSNNNNNNGRPPASAAMNDLNRFRQYMSGGNNNNNYHSPLGPSLGGEWRHEDLSFLGLTLNVCILLTAVLYLISSFFFRSMASTLYWTYAGLIVLQGVLYLYKMKLLPYITKPDATRQNNTDPFLKNCSKYYAPSIVILYIVHAALGVTPISFMVVFPAIYNLVDLLFYNIYLLSSLPAGLHKLFDVVKKSVLDRYQITRDNVFLQDQIILFAAMIEAMLTFTVFLFGGSWFTLAYIQYAIYRYHNDKYVKYSFHTIKVKIDENIMSKPFIPGFVRTLYGKLLQGIELTAYLK